MHVTGIENWTFVTETIAEESGERPSMELMHTTVPRLNIHLKLSNFAQL
jgi:hypothetical protein